MIASIRRPLVGTGCLLFGLAIGIVATRTMVRPGTPTLRSPQYQALLRTRIERLPLENVTIREALDLLEAQTGVAVEVRWRSFRERRPPITPDQRINILIERASLRSAIEQIFGQAYEVGALVIMPGEPVVVDYLPSRSRLTRVYDVRDLIYAGGEHYTQRIAPNDLKPEQRLNGARSGLFFVPKMDSWDLYHAIEDSVVTSILDTIEPDSWRSNGGLDGSISFLHGRLVITQTPQAHHQIVELLDQLRAAQTWPAPPATSP
jgi:hypothetical protein